MKSSESDLTSSRRLERRWFLACLVAWLILLPVSAWVGSHDELRWRTIAGPVNALTGAFGAAVLAALLFRRFQLRIDAQRQRDERRAWLHRNLGYALRSREAVCEALAGLAVEAYRLVGDVFGDNRVPDDMLRWDLTRKPAVGDVDASVDEQVRGVLSFVVDMLDLMSDSPVATAQQQVFARGLVHGRARTTAMVDQYGLDDAGVTRSTEAPTDAEVTLLAESVTPEAVRSVERELDRVFALMPDVTGLRSLEPSELREDGIDLVIAVHRLLRGPTSADSIRSANDVLFDVARLLAAVSSMQMSLWTITRDLLKEAQQLDSSTVRGVPRKYLTAPVDPHARNWDRWRETHDLRSTQMATE